MTTVLVTGAAGFIGGHLCRALLGRGMKLVGVDNFDPFYPRPLKEKNLAETARCGRMEFFEADIRDEAAMDALFAGHNIDAVIHLAALAGIRPSIENPLRYQDVNVGGFSVILEAMRKHAVKRLIFASSSSVYGNSGTVPFREDEPVDCPISPYAATKRAGELLAYTYHHLFNFSVHCLRFFTVYGPGQRPDLAINKFTSLMLDGRPVPVFGDGGFSRDFTFVADIVSGIMASLDRLSGYRIYNLGGRHPVTVLELVELLGQTLGIKPQIEFKPAQAGDVLRTYADISRAEKELGFQPATTLAEGLARFARWLKQQRAEQ